ncbi:MAG: hypothetical protein Q9184_003600 [Pyrenodesmia sp. 2 TL-2023]
MASSATADAAMTAEMEHSTAQQEVSTEHPDVKTDEEQFQIGYLGAKQQSCSPKYPIFDIGFRPFSVKQPALCQKNDNHTSSASERICAQIRLHEAHETILRHRRDISALAELLGGLVWECGKRAQAPIEACARTVKTLDKILDSLQLGYKLVSNADNSSKYPAFRLNFNSGLKPPRWTEKLSSSLTYQLTTVKALQIILRRQLNKARHPPGKKLKPEYRHLDDNFALWRKEMGNLHHKASGWTMGLERLQHEMITGEQDSHPAGVRTMDTRAAWMATSELATWRTDEE